MTSQNLQLAISANAAIRAVLVDRENALMERLEEASRHLSELIDNLESEFLSQTSTSPLSATPDKQAPGNSGHSQLVHTSQQEYMQALIQLLHRKEAAMERMSAENNSIMQQFVQAHEETIRHICQGREETTRALTTHFAQTTEEKE